MRTAHTVRGRVRQRSRLLALTVGGALAVSALVTLPSIPALAAGPNLVANPGFESSSTGWSASGGTFALSDDAASGSKSGSLTARGNFWDGLRGSFVEPLVHDGEYRVTAKVKHTAGTASEPFGFAFCPSVGGCVAAADASIEVPQGGWEKFPVDFGAEESRHYTA